MNRPTVVLVIDDEPVVLAAIAASQAGPDVVLRLASTLAEAEEHVGAIDVVLCDHHLGGGIDGLDWLAELGVRNPDCYRALFTGDADQALAVAAINRGHVDAFLAKPARREHLQALFRQGGETAHLRRSNRTLIHELAERNQQLEQTARSLRESVQERSLHLEVVSRELEDKHHQLVRLETQGVVAQLVRGLAHELNNPLAAILGYAQRMQRSLRGDEESGRRLAVITEEVERCRTLVEQLRKLAAPLDEALGRCQPEQILVQAAQRLVDAGRPAPTCSIDGELPAVLGAHRSLVRVFEQVLDNASQAGAGSCRLSAAHRDDRVLLFLDNDGATPDEAAIVHAAKPFYTTRSERGHRGLGLSIAASLLRDQGGTIALDCRPDAVGARITIALPTPPITQTRLQALTDPAGAPLVLVVDDEPLIAELLHDCLIEAGCQAISAATVAEAMACIEREPLRAIIADINLPDGSGIDLLHRARAARPGLEGHLALVTGDSHPEHLERLFRETGYPTLAKPFRLEQVHAFITHLL